MRPHTFGKRDELVRTDNTPFRVMPSCQGFESGQFPARAIRSAADRTRRCHRARGHREGRSQSSRVLPQPKWVRLTRIVSSFGAPDKASRNTLGENGFDRTPTMLTPRSFATRAAASRMRPPTPLITIVLTVASAGGQRSQNCNAIHSGHDQVDDDVGRRPVLQQAKEVFTVRHETRLEAGMRRGDLQRFAYDRVIVEDQNATELAPEGARTGRASCMPHSSSPRCISWPQIFQAFHWHFLKHWLIPGRLRPWPRSIAATTRED